MKLVKQAVAVVLWCVVAVGCVAEEPQPVVVEESKAAEQSASDNSGIQITTHVDPATGEEYQELKTNFVIEKINFRFFENAYLIGINEYSVLYPKGGAKSSNAIITPLGKTIFPEGQIFSPIGNLDADVFKRKKASLFCRITHPYSSEIRDNKFCPGPTGRRYRCDSNGDNDFVFNYHCSLGGDKDYFLFVN